MFSSLKLGFRKRFIKILLRLYSLFTISAIVCAAVINRIFQVFRAFNKTSLILPKRFAASPLTIKIINSLRRIIAISNAS